MKIAISGANGYIAKNLVRELKAANHKIVPVERSTLYNVKKLSEILSDVAVVINLAGAPILQRWTAANKQEIRKSRIETNQNMVKAINGLPDNKKPRIFISASAIGIYSSGKVHTERSTSFSSDFIGEVVQGWENASSDLSPKVRKVIFRIGLILGNEAKTIQNVLPLFKMGLGGKIGSGSQPFPFVHIYDAVNAIIWGIEHENARGIYNLVAPDNIDNKTFTKVLAQSVKRPAFFTVPEFALKLVLGKASSLLLQSPQVVPKRLLKEGFVFLFPEIKSCLAEVVKSKT